VPKRARRPTTHCTKHHQAHAARVSQRGSCSACRMRRSGLGVPANKITIPYA
jgi:hypothetical protein